MRGRGMNVRTENAAGLDPRTSLRRPLADREGADCWAGAPRWRWGRSPPRAPGRNAPITSTWLRHRGRRTSACAKAGSARHRSVVERPYLDHQHRQYGLPDGHERIRQRTRWPGAGPARRRRLGQDDRRNCRHQLEQHRRPYPGPHQYAGLRRDRNAELQHDLQARLLGLSGRAGHLNFERRRHRCELALGRHRRLHRVEIQGYHPGRNLLPADFRRNFTTPAGTFSEDSDVPFVGLYTAYTKGNLVLDGQVRWDFYQNSLTDATTASQARGSTRAASPYRQRRTIPSPTQQLVRRALDRRRVVACANRPAQCGWTGQRRRPVCPRHRHGR